MEDDEQPLTRAFLRETLHEFLEQILQRVRALHQQQTNSTPQTQSIPQQQPIFNPAQQTVSAQRSANSFQYQHAFPIDPHFQQASRTTNSNPKPEGRMRYPSLALDGTTSDSSSLQPRRKPLRAATTDDTVVERGEPWARGSGFSAINKQVETGKTSTTKKRKRTAVPENVGENITVRNSQSATPDPTAKLSSRKRLASQSNDPERTNFSEASTVDMIEVTFPPEVLRPASPTPESEDDEGRKGRRFWGLEWEQNKRLGWGKRITKKEKERFLTEAALKALEQNAGFELKNYKKNINGLQECFLSVCTRENKGLTAQFYLNNNIMAVTGPCQHCLEQGRQCFVVMKDGYFLKEEPGGPLTVRGAMRPMTNRDREGLVHAARAQAVEQKEASAVDEDENEMTVG